MSNIPSTPPPRYGAVTSQPTSSTEELCGLPATPPPDYQFPQPGAPPPPQGAHYPQDPPPLYEPPKDGQYSTPGYPPQGAYQPNPTYPIHPGYPPTAGYQTVQPVALHHTVYLQTLRWSPLPQNVQCSHCHTTSVSTISYKPGALTWLAGGLLCLFGCWIGCCLIPFCMPDLQDVEHRCSMCGKYLGTHMRM